MPPQDFPPCAAGLTICKSGQVVCNGAVGPTTEICDGIDNDCNGTIDEPNPCPGELVCVSGTCRSPCQSGEYPIGGGLFGGKPYVTGINARGTLKRSDFGMTYAVDNGLVGDEVTLILGFEARRQDRK
jgi:hypothetical protein